MERIIEGLARGITKEKLTEFYADPTVQAEFEAWKKKRELRKVSGRVHDPSSRQQKATVNS